MLTHEMWQPPRSSAVAECAWHRFGPILMSWTGRYSWRAQAISATSISTVHQCLSWSHLCFEVMLVVFYGCSFKRPTPPSCCASPSADRKSCEGPRRIKLPAQLISNACPGSRKYVKRGHSSLKPLCTVDHFITSSLTLRRPKLPWRHACVLRPRRLRLMTGTCGAL